MKKLLESAGELAEMVGRAPFGMSTTGLDGRFLRVNGALCQMLGYSERELLATTWMQLVHLDDLEVSEREIERLSAEPGSCMDFEMRYIHRTGVPVWVRQRVSVAPSYEDKPPYCVCFLEDITKRKRVEEESRESEERFRIMADGCPSMIWATDSAGNVQFTNLAYREFVGVDREQIAKHEWQMVVHPDDAPEYAMKVQRAVREHTSFKAEARIQRADGEWRWLASQAEPRISSYGEFLGHVGTSPDVTDRKQIEQALQSSEEKFRQITESIHEVFWMMPPTADQILYVSPAYERVWERTCDGLYQNPMSWAEAIHPDDLERAHLLFARQIKGELVNSEYRIRTPKGQEKWIRDRAFPVRDRAGQLIRVVGIAEEITEAKGYENELILAREAADAANESKSSFLANMSHEIRTPLNGVIGMTDLALETQLTSEQREYLDTVKLSADSLLSVINDILDFSKIEAGKVDIEAVDFNLYDCLETMMKTLAFGADEKGLELLCDVAPDVPEIMRGDSGRLRQVLINLIGNAIKFTTSGEVVLRVRFEGGDAQDSVLHFEVSDTGIGIPAKNQQSIFDSFSQADSSTTRTYGGTGLGLTISKRLVEMMGGTIRVESVAGHGSHFYFAVKMGTADAKVLEVGAITPQVLRGVRVLIVDDNRSNRRILEGMLKRWAMKTTLVENGEQALVELCAANNTKARYGLILLDMHMPKMDGFDLVERIRQRPELSAPMVVMLTSAGQRGDAERCRELGIAAYLLKPVRQSELRDAIARVLGTAKQKETIPLINRRLPRDSHDPGMILRVLRVEDNAVNQRLALRLLERRGHDVVVAANGREALDVLSRESFDLVLMDVQMPEMDGLEATALLRKKERESSTKYHQLVIALTAHAMKGDYERCVAAGMDGYLAKPIRPSELDEILEKCSAGVNQIAQKPNDRTSG